MAKATRNFHFDGKFYAAGTEVPQAVKDQVWAALFEASESPEKPEQPAPPVNPQSEDDPTPEGEPAGSQEGEEAAPTKDEAYFSGLNKEQLVEEAKKAGITGKATKDELIEKLVEHYG